MRKTKELGNPDEAKKFEIESMLRNDELNRLNEEKKELNQKEEKNAKENAKKLENHEKILAYQDQFNKEVMIQSDYYKRYFEDRQLSSDKIGEIENCENIASARLLAINDVIAKLMKIPPLEPEPPELDQGFEF